MLLFTFSIVSSNNETSSTCQMDLEEIDFVSKLLTIGQGWGRNFFVSCLLYLSPEDLKACRLVNKTWNKVIKEGVWGNKRVRKKLEEELVWR